MTETAESAKSPAGVRLDLIGNGQTVVAEVVLDRAPVNALDLATLERIATIVVGLAGRPAILRADGPHFSAGHDLMETDRLREGGYLARCSAALEAVLMSPGPLIGVVHGAAIGTGLILAACCDLLVIVDGARLALPEVERGLLGGAGHAARWLEAPWVRRAVLLGEDIPTKVLLAGGALGAPDGETACRTARTMARRLAERQAPVVASAREVLRELGADAAAVHRGEMARNAAFRSKPGSSGA